MRKRTEIKEIKMKYGNERNFKKFLKNFRKEKEIKEEKGS